MTRMVQPPVKCASRLGCQSSMLYALWSHTSSVAMRCCMICIRCRDAAVADTYLCVRCVTRSGEHEKAELPEFKSFWKLKLETGAGATRVVLVASIPALEFRKLALDYPLGDGQGKGQGKVYAAVTDTFPCAVGDTVRDSGGRGLPEPRVQRGHTQCLFAACGRVHSHRGVVHGVQKTVHGAIVPPVAHTLDVRVTWWLGTP